jgi:hypothetical protein
MLLEDKLGCITELGDYVPYYDEKGLCIKDTPVYESLYERRSLTPEEMRYFDLYYSKPAA